VLIFRFLHSLFIVAVHVCSGLKLSYLLYFDMAVIFMDIIRLFTIKTSDVLRIQVSLSFIAFCFIMYWLEHNFEAAKRVEFYLRLEVMRGQQVVTVAKEYEDIDKAKNAFLANV
jgi:hypothetical protein